MEAALAENAGLRARLMVQAREAGVLDERQRMAREIHDTLTQGLAGVLTQLQAAEQTLDEPRALGRHLAIATNLARESLVEGPPHGPRGGTGGARRCPAPGRDR